MRYETRRYLKERLLRAWRGISPHRGLGRKFPILKRMGAWLEKPPALLEDKKAAVRTGSLSFPLHLLREDPSISPRIFSNHIWEEHVTSVFKEEVSKTAGSVLDIGAHIGYYTVMGGLLLKAKGEGARVFAFEPEPQNFELLKKNITENNLEDTVAVIFKAAGDQNQRSSIYGSDSSDTSDRFIFNAPGSKVQGEVECVRAADYLKKNFPGAMESIQIIKMDIEGYEPQACRGMEELLKRPDVTLFTEMNFRRLREAGSSAEDYYRQLLSYGFKVSVIDLRSKEGQIQLSEPTFDSLRQGEEHLDLFCQKV